MSINIIHFSPESTNYIAALYIYMVENLQKTAYWLVSGLQPTDSRGPNTATLYVNSYIAPSISPPGTVHWSGAATGGLGPNKITPYLEAPRCYLVAPQPCLLFS